MPNYLTRFKEAEKKLSLLTQTMPDLALSLDHLLQTFFPRVSAAICTHELFMTYEAPSEPGQTAELVSISLSTFIEICYLRREVPTYEDSAIKVYDTAYTLDEAHHVKDMSMSQIKEFVECVINNLEDSVKKGLRHFWETPLVSLENKRPKEWLINVARELFEAESELRYNDKTLSATAYAYTRQLLYFPSYTALSEGGLSKPLRVYEVALKAPVSALDAPLKDLMVIAHSSLSNLENNTDTFIPATKPPLVSDKHRVVLFSPGSGLEEFESLHALSLELDARLKDEYQREALLDYALLKDRQIDQNLYKSVGFREISTDVFEYYVTGLIDKQNQNLSYVWETAAVKDTQYNLELLGEQVAHALNISFSLNPKALLKTRYARLFESQLPAWLRLASEDKKLQWRLAVERLKQERLLSQTGNNTPLLKNGRKVTLRDYAKHQLKLQIRIDHQLEIDPDNVYISTTEAYNTSPGFYPLFTSGYTAGVSVHRTGPTITYRTIRRSLSDLALENVGFLDLNYALTARVVDWQGKRHPTLTTPYLKTLVRTLDIGKNYESLLYKHLVDPESEQVTWRKERYIAVTKAKLRLDILESELSGTLTEEEATKVDAVLNFPTESSRPEVNGKYISVHLLTLRDKPMLGVFVITTYHTPDLLCYTPDAPDKIWFRRASSLDELMATLSHKTLHNYVLERVSSATQPYIKQALKEGLNFFDAGLQVVTDHFLQAYYDADAAFVIRNADEQSTSTFEANVQTAKDIALTVIDVISFALPLKILLPLALARFIYSAAEGFDALERGEKREAMLHFFESISHLTDGASDFAGSTVFGRSIRQRARIPFPNLNPKAASTKAKTNMTLRNRDRYGNGIYELVDISGEQPSYYLQDAHDNLYRSQYDSLIETWQVIDERQPNAIYRIPVYEVSEGRWGISPARHGTYPSLQELIERATIDINLSNLKPDVNGIYKVNQLYYIQQSGVAFEVQYGWLGRHLYLNLPGTSRGNQHSYKVRRSIEGSHWEVKRRQSDNSKQWEPLTLDRSRQSSITSTSSVLTYSDYDAEPEHVAALKYLIEMKQVNFNSYFLPRHTEGEAARAHIEGIQRKMLTDSLAFFKAWHPISRHKPPKIDAYETHEAIFNKLYEKYSGVIIGEAHSDTSSKKIIMDNMAFLAKSNVKVLYMEHLQTDLHQPYLNEFFRTGKMPPSLEKFLNDQDKGHRIDRRSPYNFTNLVQKTQRYGIRVKAIDCVASYYSKTLMHLDAKSIRHEMLSYGASKIIRQHTAKVGKHKWIALTGNTHANTYNGVPGLAELEDVVGVRVQDVAPGKSQGINTDPGIIYYHPTSSTHYSLLKNDWVLGIEVLSPPPSPPTPTRTRLDVILPRPGMFTFDNDSIMGPILAHRTLNGRIRQSPLIFNNDGTFYIYYPEWPDIHLTTYSALQPMINDLKLMNMLEV